MNKLPEAALRRYNRKRIQRALLMVGGLLLVYAGFVWIGWDELSGKRLASSAFTAVVWGLLMYAWSGPDSRSPAERKKLTEA